MATTEHRRTQERYDQFANRVEFPMALLALFWLPVLIYPLLRPLSGPANTVVNVINVAIWLCYVAEYVVKLNLAPDRRAYVRHHVLNLALVVLPVFRPLQSVRLLRLLALGRIALVFSSALRRVGTLVRYHGLHLALLAVALCTVVGGGLIYLAERHVPHTTFTTISGSMWWSLDTIINANSGALQPNSAWGRTLEAALTIVRIAFVAILGGVVASYLIEGQSEKETAQILEELATIKAAVARLAETAPVERGEAQSEPSNLG